MTMKKNCLSSPNGFLRWFQPLLTRALLALVLGTALGGVVLARAANIVWVTDNSPSDGFSAATAGAFAEDGWYTLLQNAGHSVIRYNPPNSQNTLLPTADVAALNTNDLIILGRSVGSGAFQAPQVGGWNSNIFKPLLSINAYLTRAVRAGWFSGSTLPNGVPTVLSAFNLADPKTAYLFAGVAMSGTNTANVYDEAGGQNTSQIVENPVAGGVRIANAIFTELNTVNIRNCNIISDWPSNTLVRANADRLGGYLVVTNYAGSVTSTIVALDVTPDVDPPYIVSIGSLDGTIVGVQFNEEINPLYVSEPSNFAINGGAGVVALSATLRPDGRTVKLVLDQPITGAFTVDAYDLTDYSGVFTALTGTNATVLGFTVGDIGGPVAAGTHVTFDNQIIEMSGGGADFWLAADQGHLATTPLLGNFDVRVRVNALTRPDNIAKAALFARESRDANSRGLHVSVNPPAPGRNQYELTLRPTTGGNSALVGAAFAPANIPNAWLRLTRTGLAFTGFRSTNGTDWIPLGTTNQVFGPTMLVGLGVTAHTNGGLIATGTFSGLTIIQPARAELSLTQSAHTNVVNAGQPVSYLITVSNAGPDTATNVVVNDTLSALGTFVSATPSQGSFTSTPNSFAWNAGTLAAGGSATITMQASANAAGLLTNSAAAGSELNDPNAANNAASATVQILQPVSPVLSGSGSTNGVFFASFASVSGTGYEVQYRHALTSLPCPDLAPCPGPDSTPWTTLTNLPGTGGPLTFTDANPGLTNRFYRIILR